MEFESVKDGRPRFSSWSSCRKVLVWSGVLLGLLLVVVGSSPAQTPAVASEGGAARVVAQDTPQSAPGLKGRSQAAPSAKRKKKAEPTREEANSDLSVKDLWKWVTTRSNFTLVLAIGGVIAVACALIAIGLIFSLAAALRPIVFVLRLLRSKRSNVVPLLLIGLLLTFPTVVEEAAPVSGLQDVSSAQVQDAAPATPAPATRKKKSAKKQPGTTVSGAQTAKAGRSDNSKEIEGILYTAFIAFWVYWIFSLVLAVFVALCLYGSEPDERRKKGFIVADYSIPFCNYLRLEDGFLLTFRRRPVAFRGTVTLILFAPFVFLWVVFHQYRLEVTSEAVIVNGRKFRRAEFGVFYVENSITPGYSEEGASKHGHRVGNVTLGYSYGNLHREWGGIWRQDYATRFLAALNAQIKNPSTAGPQITDPPRPVRVGGSGPTEF